MKLTKPQQLIYDSEKVIGGSVAVMCGIMTVDKICPEADVVEAIKQIYQTNDALNYRLDESGAEPQMFYESPEGREVKVLRVNSLSELEAIGEKTATTPFDMRGWLSELTAVIHPDGYGIIVKVHHILGDAWSMSLIGTQLNAILEGNEWVRYSYENYVESEKEYLESKRYCRDRQFFLNMFQECKDPLMLSDKQSETYSVDVMSRTLSPQMRAALRNYAEKNDISEFVCLLGAFSVLYGKLKNCAESFFVGMPVLNRFSEKDMNTIGMYVNTVPVSVHFDYEKSFAENLKQLENSVFSAFKHQRFNYNDTLKAISDEFGYKGKLYDCTVNYETDEIFSVNTMRSKEYHCDKQTESLRLFIQHRNRGAELVLDYTYHNDVFSEQEIDRFNSMLMRVINLLLTNDEQALKDISIVDEGEKKLLNSFNNTAVDYDKTKSVYDLFAEQAEKEPEKTALASAERNLSYSQLKNEAARVAKGLVEKGIEKGDIVAFCLPRDSRILCAMLGIMQIGAAYLPLDTSQPKERIEYILKDSGAKLCITEENYASILSSEALNKKASVCSEDLCYCIYTSGSTGMPKGVMISHGNTEAYVSSLKRIYGAEGVNMPFFTSPGVDLSVTSLYLPLISGGTVYIYGEELNKALPEIISNEKISVIKATPSHMRIMCSLNLNREMKNVKHIIVGGEALYRDDVSEFINHFGKHMAVHNEYGPTETTVGCMDYVFNPNEEEKTVPIGKPIANTQIYIVDKYMKPVPLGVTGELCIAGDNVGQGYLNRPELTKEKFVENPFGEGKLYKTGDLAYWREDGNIVFVGRNDFQVKINGQRVELGEIESALTSIEGIESAAVIVRSEDDRQLLCAFYTGTEIEISQLRAVLSKKLPRYMVPQAFSHLEEMPLNTSGKTDRRALEQKQVSFASEEYHAPESEAEKALAEVLSEVLGVEKVGRNDNYFALGGDSIRAIHVVSQLFRKGYDLTVTELMQGDTLSSIAAKIRLIDKEESDNYSDESIEQEENGFIYDLTPAQEGIYVQSLDKKNTKAYQLFYLFEIDEKTDVEKLKGAIRLLAVRHPVLRTAFAAVEGRVKQVVLADREPYMESKQIDSAYKEGELNEIIEEKSAYTFDLQRDSLMRCFFIEFLDKKFFFLHTHHLITDGWSMSVLFRDLYRFYQLLSENNSPGVIEKEIEEEKAKSTSFASYVNLVRAYDSNEMKNYWAELLSEGQPCTLTKKAKTDKVNVLQRKTEIKPELRREIEEFSRRNHIPVNTVLEAVFSLTLHKYTGMEDLIYNKTISGKSVGLPKLEQTAGPMINTVPVRVSYSEETTNKDYIKQINTNSVNANEYGFLALSDIYRSNGIDPNEVDVLFIFENYDPYFLDYGKTLMQMVSYKETTEFPLTVILSPVEDGFILEFNYDENQISDEFVEAIQSGFVSIAKRLIEADENAALSDCLNLTDEEKQTVFYDFNNTAVPYDKTKSVYDLFEEQVKNTQAYIQDGEKKYTFIELDEAASKVDSYIRKTLGSEKQVIGVICERSFEELASIFGIIRGGNAYMPISSDYPKERIETMLETSGCQMVIAQKKYCHFTEKAKAVEDILSANENEIIPAPAAKPEDTLYAIYTSGSTGTPKGAMVSNRSAVNRIGWMADKYFDSSSVIMLKTPYTFDVSAWEILGFAMYGFSLYILPPDMHYSQKQVLNHIEKGGVTDLHFVPTVFEQFLAVLKNTPDSEQKLSSLKNVILSGESLPAKSVNELGRYKNGRIRVHNLYGPAECAIDVTSYDCKETETDPVPIGKPIANTQIYIVDKYMKPVPIGVTGELCIAGDNVGQGYLNRPELTKEKFVENPFGEGKLYKTGDLAYWREDGNIVFVGRNDFQVKINGQRVELGEIESALTSIEGIESAAVIVRSEDDRQLLCAFYTGTEIEVSQLRAVLSKTLPRYMVPQAFSHLEEMPLNTSGKTDRRALEQKQVSFASEEYHAPESEAEKALAEVLSEVLGVEKVGRNDNYFALGGDSIRAIHVVSQLFRKGYDLTVTELMRSDTLKDIAVKAKRIKAEDNSASNMQDNIIPLPPIAKAYLKSGTADLSHFSQGSIISTTADIETVQNAFKELSKRHGMLRAVMFKDALRVLGEAEFDELFNITDLSENSICSNEDAKKRLLEHSVQFSSDGGLLIDVAGCLTESGCLLRVTLHHYIVDLFSWEILLSDFLSVINSIQNHRAVILPEATASYGEWMQTLEEYKTEMPPDEVAYWMQCKAQLERAVSLRSGADEIMQAESIDAALDSEVSAALINAEQNSNLRLDVLLLSALGCAAARLADGSVGICVESHGRTQLHKPLLIDRTVGWFTSIYPIAFEQNTVNEELIQSVHRTLQKVPNNGIGWLLKYEKLPENADLLFNFYRYREEVTSVAAPVIENEAIALDSLFPGIISVDCELRENNIFVHIRAPRLKRSEKLLQNLADGFIDAAKEISELQLKGKTLPSEVERFSDNSLSSEDWSALESLFNGMDENEQN